MNLKPYSAIFLSLAGLILAGMGLYFIFIRPSLLPEDLDYMGTTLQSVRDNISGLLNWLQKVFWMMDGHTISTGLLTLIIAFTSYRKKGRRSLQYYCNNWNHFNRFNVSCELYDRLRFQMALIFFFNPVGNCVNSLPAKQIGNKNGILTTKIQ